eukprot:364764-Chlamydomonas_euryale.AAC.2
MAARQWRHSRMAACRDGGTIARRQPPHFGAGMRSYVGFGARRLWRTVALAPVGFGARRLCRP